MTFQDDHTIERQRPWTDEHRVLIHACDVRVSDYIPLLGRVVAVSTEADDVKITTVYDAPIEIRLGPNMPLWIDRLPRKTPTEET